MLISSLLSLRSTELRMIAQGPSTSSSCSGIGAAGLESCHALLSLDVTGNQLTSLEGLRGCVLLERINAAHNALRELTWQDLPLLALGSLDLSSNRCSFLIQHAGSDPKQLCLRIIMTCLGAECIAAFVSHFSSSSQQCSTIC